MKNHAKKFLEKLTEHHLNLSKTHAGLSEHFHGLVKSMSADDHMDQIAVHHQAASDYHKAMATDCDNMAKVISQSDAVALPAVDGGVPTNANSFSGREFTASSADELFKRWFDQQPKFSAVAPSDESLRRTNRLVDRDGKELDPRTGDELGKSAKPTEAVPSLGHWFE